METKGELGALEKLAEGIDGDIKAAGPEGVQAQQEVAEQNALLDINVKGFMMILDMAAPAFGMVGYPSVGRVLDDEKRQMLAMVWAPVATKYGWNLGDMGTRFKEELAALAVTVPIGAAVFAGIKEDIAARNAKPSDANLPDTKPAVLPSAAAKSEYPQATLLD